MSESIDLRVLARYFDGNARADEAIVLAWIGNDPKRRAAVAELSAAWAADARSLEAPYDAPAAWARTASELGFGTPTDRSASVSRRSRRAARTRHSPVGGAWAAAALVALAMGGWWSISKHEPDATAAVVPSPVREREYRTARAQRAVVRLSDGSEVTLNADSRLRIPADFGRNKRELHLEGEGYFIVVHDTAAPFTVHTARGIARDLGTRFSVRAYEDDRARELQVVVAEGAVSISALAGVDTLVLRASEAGRVTEEGELRAAHGVDVRSRLGWTEGRLEFRNVALHDVVPVLARWYDADVQVGDPELATYPITATLTGERFSDAVEAIAHVLNARVVQRGNSAVFVRQAARR